MIVLGFECSAVAAGAAVVRDGVLLSECYLNIGLTHSETLMTLADNALKNAKLDVSDVDIFAVSDGPGSFTGLRIGIGTVKGLAMGLGKETCGVSPLLALCYNVPCYKGYIAPIMDARRGEVYNAVYKWENGEPREIVPMRALPVEKLAAELAEGALFLGDGVRVHRKRILEILGEKADFPTENLMYQRASSIALAAGALPKKSYNDLLPVYIRKPQAERVREERETSEKQKDCNSL